MNALHADDVQAGVCPYSGALRWTRADVKTKNLPQRKPDSQVMEEVLQWMTKKLPCVAGRREFNRGRYMIRIATRETVPAIFEEYKRKLASGEVVACLFIFNDPRFYEGQGDVSEAFHFLAEQMSLITDQSPSALANGAPLTNKIRLTCPVTNLATLYDDFECIAFCPQSNDREDPLYDPLMSTPYPAVNMSSDVYAFSRFVSDSAEIALKHPVHEEHDREKLEKFFDMCVERWQRVAVATIGNFEAITDTSLCPVHVTDDQQYWLAAHKDPAFAEQIKEVHKHELPVKYGRRIVQGWLDHFLAGQRYEAAGLARDGLPV